MGKYYRLAEAPDADDLKRLGLTVADLQGGGDIGIHGFSEARPRQILALPSEGKLRPPKKGEWYLSGAIPQAWRALNDLTTPYVIVRLLIAFERRIIVEEFPGDETD
jgi:hypothetical protein